jgi:hypothetical protein
VSRKSVPGNSVNPSSAALLPKKNEKIVKKQGKIRN